jgi:hypothetical protein
MSSAISRLLFICSILSVFSVLLTYLVLVDRLAPWEDELFVVSAGLSIARSGVPIESVMALYPRSDSPIRFYGPVSFEAEALLIRAFGLSMRAWRLLCFGGVVFNLIVAIFLVRAAGGDRWSQLITALVLSLSGFTAAMQPGRWDFVTSGLFFCGLLVFVSGIEASLSPLCWRATIAGTFLGFSLGSTPRALTLCVAAFLTVMLLVILFPKTRRNLLLGSAVAGVQALVTHNVLLRPWGLNTLSWYAYVRKSTTQDPKNSTPITGIGAWSLDLSHHKTLLLVVLCLLVASIFGARVRHQPGGRNGRRFARIFLALFATTNLLLMLLLTRGSLGLSSFWLTPMVITLMAWCEWHSPDGTRFRIPAAIGVGAALLILGSQAARQVAAISLTWGRRSTESLEALVRKSVPRNAVIYGPIDGYLYSVERAERSYLYLYEQERLVIPWLPANPHFDNAIPIDEDLDDQICAGPTYVMWPVPDNLRQPLGESMPSSLLSRLGPKVAELRQPPLPKWKESTLDRLGEVGGKFGFPDVAIFQLRSSVHCGKGSPID